jgi:hypothetical protein
MFSFDLQQFLGILEQYNLAIWPLQIFAYIIGLIALFLTIRKAAFSDKIVLLILSLYCLWTGIVFCLYYWTKVYPFAKVFGVLLIIQALFFLASLIKSNISFRLRTDLYSIIGIIFIFYAMVGYQLLGYFIGHSYPRFFAVGLVPCPTTIFTFGLFMLSDRKFPKYLLVIPLLFSLSGSLAVYWGIYEDIGLFITGLLGTYLIIRRDRASQR